MVRADRKPLSGDVEVDEAFVGGVEHGAKRGRGVYKCIVVMVVTTSYQLMGTYELNGLLFHRLIEQVVSTDQVTETDLTSGDA